jgi:hypothetical protein
VRKASFSRLWLDDLPDCLEINADLVMVDRQAAVYQASLSHQGKTIASMRLTLMTIASGMTIGQGTPS